jgi:hypothetical protein
MRHPFITFLIDLGPSWWLQCIITATAVGVLSISLHLALWQAIPLGLSAGYVSSKLYQSLRSSHNG